jgi:hypothetical protein
MSLRAIAFHRSVSAKRMEELNSDWNVVFATSTVAQCEKCKEKFAVFLSDRDDVQNDKYVADLKNRISQGCNKAKHSEVEIRLDVVP